MDFSQIAIQSRVHFFGKTKIKVEWITTRRRRLSKTLVSCAQACGPYRETSCAKLLVLQSKRRHRFGPTCAKCSACAKFSECGAETGGWCTFLRLHLTGEFCLRSEYTGVVWSGARFRWCSLIFSRVNRHFFPPTRNVFLISAENDPLRRILVYPRNLIEGRTNMVFSIHSQLDQRNLTLSISPREPCLVNKHRNCDPMKFKRTPGGVTLENEIWGAFSRIDSVPLGTVHTYTIENKATNDILFQKKIR